jgi:hypothetical protein
MCLSLLSEEGEEIQKPQRHGDTVEMQKEN